MNVATGLLILPGYKTQQEAKPELQLVQQKWWADAAIGGAPSGGSSLEAEEATYAYRDIYSSVGGDWHQKGNRGDFSHP